MPARSSLIRSLIALLLIIFILPFSHASGADAPLPELLGVTVGAASTAQPARADQRTRSALLNLSEIEHTRADLDAGRAPGALGLSLFAGTNLVARFEKIEHLPTGGYTLTGTIDGSRFGEIHLSVVGSALDASVNASQGLYRISSPDGQTAQITQIDPNLLPPEEEQVPPAPAAADTLAPAAVTAGPSTTDDGSRIDVYVGYTANARSQVGGTAAIQAKIATAIAETNTGYANSGIKQRVVLVGSGEYAYNDTNLNWNTALSQWSNPADAVFGPAHTLRNTLKADEMVLLVGTDPNYCGLAWLMGPDNISTSFAASSFAVVSWPCATGYYSFGHEMGHNMGAHHDRITAGTEQGAYPYSYGYQWFDTVDGVYYRTVMAYNVYGSDIRINYWSNPNVSYLGRNPTGVGTGSPNSAYNALTLNNTAPIVAMFRDGNAPAAPTNLAATPLSATSYRLDWTDNSSDEMRFRIERALSGSTAWVEIGTAAANSTTYSDPTAVSGAAYQYRVLSDNGNGRSVSNIAAPPVPLPPPPPSGLLITASGPNFATLQWTANGGNETSFLIKRAPAAVDTWTSLGSVGAGVTTYPDTTLPDGAGYRYQVFAENAEGTSGGSNIASLPAMPAAPGALTASGLSQTSLRLNWVDHATSEDGYKIERAPVGGSFSPLATLVGVNGVTYTDASVPPTGEYQYRVYAYNSRGNSAYSGVVDGLPSQPTLLSNIVVNNSLINLSWTDISQIENGYKVDRSLDGGASYQPLASLGANSQSYSDNAASCGTNRYRVYTYDAAGNSVYATTSGTTAPCKPVVTVLPGTSTVFLTWTAASGAQSYYVEEWKFDSGFLTISYLISAAGPTSFLVSSLAKGTTYQFRVMAINSLGKTPSDPVTVVTMNSDVFLPLMVR